MEIDYNPFFITITYINSIKNIFFNILLQSFLLNILGTNNYKYLSRSFTSTFTFSGAMRLQKSFLSKFLLAEEIFKNYDWPRGFIREGLEFLTG